MEFSMIFLFFSSHKRTHNILIHDCFIILIFKVIKLIIVYQYVAFFLFYYECQKHMWWLPATCVVHVHCRFLSGIIILIASLLKLAKHKKGFNTQHWCDEKTRADTTNGRKPVRDQVIQFSVMWLTRRPEGQTLLEHIPQNKIYMWAKCTFWVHIH